jgi:adenylyl cyclase-associated protein
MCDCLTALKHVTPDMQTHKNAALRAGPAPFKAPVVSNTHRSVSAFKPVDKPPALYKDGKKWIVVSVITLQLTVRLLVHKLNEVKLR